MNANQRNALLSRGYLLGAQIGKGTYGTVFQCTAMNTHITYAVKAMDLRTLRMRAEFDQSRLLREIEVMKRLKHPFIVNLHDVIQEQDALFLVMELVVGIDLFDTIVAKGGLDELGGKFLFYQLCSAVGHMHDQGILHRDIKPENILLRGPTPGHGNTMIGSIPSKSWIKLLDFGLSKVNQNGDMNSFVGTPRYIAPEVISVGEEEKRRRLGITNDSVMDSSTTNNEMDEEQGQLTYSTPADCFSTGITLFVMLANCFPKFDNGIIAFDKSPKAVKLSLEARDIILKLTHPDPSQRISMKEALYHEWLSPAKSQVEALISTESHLVVAPTRPLKRVFLERTLSQSASVVPPLSSSSTANTSWQQQQPQTFSTVNNGPFQFGAAATTTSTGATFAFPSAEESLQFQQRNPIAGTLLGNQLFFSSSPPASSNTPGTSLQPYQGTSSITFEVDAEFWNASMTNPVICSSSEVRQAIHLTRDLLQKSERVVLHCAQTGISVLDVIPDVRLALKSGESSFEFVQVMLDTVKEWIAILKNESGETLQLSHSVLISLGSVIRQISESPDFVVDSVAAMSLTNDPSNTKKNKSSYSGTLLHFERVEHLIRVHESFWGRMETALTILQQRATIIDTMMKMVSKNSNLIMFERFEQKLDEYFALWQSAATLCQQFSQPSSNNGNINPNVTVPPLSSTVVVFNETSPTSSLESYDSNV